MQAIAVEELRSKASIVVNHNHVSCNSDFLKFDGRWVLFVLERQCILHFFPFGALLLYQRKARRRDAARDFFLAVG
jgi:hypothetical protein